MSRDLDKAVSSIVKLCSPIAVATYGDNEGILVIANTLITSRARRNEEVRSAMGKYGKKMDLMVYTPSEVAELRDETECPLGRVLEDCSVIYGSLDGIL